MRSLLLASIAIAVAIGTAAAQDVEAGEKSFRKCNACHAIGEGAQHKLGPMLNGLDGRTSGTIEGYNYSAANKAASIVWSEATFKDYIIDPRARIPNTKMIFPGIKNEREQTDLWAYLKQFGPDGKIRQ